MCVRCSFPIRWLSRSMQSVAARQRLKSKLAAAQTYRITPTLSACLSDCVCLCVCVSYRKQSYRRRGNYTHTNTHIRTSCTPHSVAIVARPHCNACIVMRPIHPTPFDKIRANWACKITRVDSWAIQISFFRCCEALTSVLLRSMSSFFSTVFVNMLLNTKPVLFAKHLNRSVLMFGC